MATTAAPSTVGKIVQVIGPAAAPPGARLVATDATAHALEPIHLVPLVAAIGVAA